MYKRLAVVLACLTFASNCFGSDQTTTLCSNLGHVTSYTGSLDVNSDVWNPGQTGSQCVYVSEDFTKLEATWSWPNGGTSVHSYPHVSFKSPLLPATISSITNLTIRASWTVSPSTDAMYNVALDMFADTNITASQFETEAAFEMMVWLATFGGPTPLGFSNGPICCTQTLNGVTFLLYRGINVRGHTTYSWEAQNNFSEFNMDISPLLHALSNNNLVPANANLGLVEFGSEAFHSTENITFSASNFTMDLESNGKISHSGSARLEIQGFLVYGLVLISILYHIPRNQAHGRW